MKKINTLVVGLGKIGFEYDKNLILGSKILSHTKAIKKNKNFKLVGAVDINKKKRNIFQSIYKVKAFKSVKDCNDMKIDLAVISTPPKFQYKIFKSLANMNIKNIICEKPISVENSDAKKIFELSKKKKIKVIVNFLRRYNPAIIKLKKKLDKFKLGKVSNGYFWYKENLKYGGCHFIDLILYFFGKPAYFEILDSKINKSPNLMFVYNNFKIYLFSSPKSKYEIGKFELQTNSNIITYEDDKDIKIFKIINNKIIVKEKNLVLGQKISYKKNMNLKFVYDEFLKIMSKKYDSRNLNDSIFNLKLCNLLLKKK